MEAGHLLGYQAALIMAKMTPDGYMEYEYILGEKL